MAAQEKGEHCGFEAAALGVPVLQPGVRERGEVLMRWRWLAERGMGLKEAARLPPPLRRVLAVAAVDRRLVERDLHHAGRGTAAPRP